MARMLSTIASSIRGSIGGLTFLSNQFHQIVVRQRTAPVDPSTDNQALIRSGLAEASVAWDGILPTAQDDWDHWAESIIFTGPLGTYTVPGRQLFTMARAYQNYLIGLGASISQSVIAPTINSLLKIGSVSAEAPPPSGVGVTVKIVNSDAEDAVCLVERSIPFTHSRRRFKGPFVSGSAKLITITGGHDDQADFTDLEAGKKYFFRVSAVTASHAPRFSPRYICSAVAVAAP
jgi:hypothetical protein